MTKVKFPLTSREISLAAALAATSAVLQLIHIGYQSPQWGMWIDLVAVSWLVAFFLFGIRSAIIVSLLGAVIITLFSPSTWLGAIMKWIATLPMYGILFLWLKARGKKLVFYKKSSRLIVPIIIAVILRAVIVLPVNYYFAIPIWTGMTTAQAIEAIPWYIIVGFNALQGVLDVILAWILVFTFRLSRYASWDQSR